MIWMMWRLHLIRLTFLHLPHFYVDPFPCWSLQRWFRLLLLLLIFCVPCLADAASAVANSVCVADSLHTPDVIQESVRSHARTAVGRFRIVVIYNGIATHIPVSLAFTARFVGNLLDRSVEFKAWKQSTVKYLSFVVPTLKSPWGKREYYTCFSWSAWNMHMVKSGASADGTLREYGAMVLRIVTLQLEVTLDRMKSY